MSIYSVVLLVVAVLSAISTAYIIFNANKGIEPLYVLASFIITVSNVGYFLMSDCNTYGSLVIANAIAYIGGIFLPLIMMIMLADFSGTKLPKWFLAVMTGVNIYIYVLVILSFRSEMDAGNLDSEFVGDFLEGGVYVGDDLDGFDVRVVR